MAEAILARMATGIALHQALLLLAVGIVLLGRRVVPRGLPRGVFALLSGVALATVSLFLLETGRVSVFLNELPWSFQIAVGAHFAAWVSLLDRDSNGSSGMRIATLLSGIVVIWSLGSMDLYGGSEFGMRCLQALVLLGSIVVGAGMRGQIEGTHGTEAFVEERSTFDSPRFAVPVRWGVGILVVGGVILLTAWSMELGDRAADQSYRWLRSSQETSRLIDQAGQVPLIATTGGTSDSTMHQLPKRADLDLSDRFRFAISFDDESMFRQATEEVIYLRTSALAVLSEDGLMGPLRSGSWIYDSDDGEENGETWLTSPEPSFQGAISYWTLIERSDSTALPLMVGAESVGVSGIYALAEDWYQLALREEQLRVRYEVRARPRIWEKGTGNGFLRKGDAPIDYLQLPAGPLTDRILEVVQSVAPRNRDLQERLEGIHGYLQENCRYSLRYDNPGNLSPVDNFLFDERKGHCELFAASAAMLTRAIGVPSRVALGFSGGQRDTGRQMVAFRQSDYHAWTEIYLEDQGWTVFDTTPDGWGAASLAEENPEAPAFSGVDLARYENLGSERLLGQIEVSRFSRWSWVLIDWVSRWFIAICGMGFLIWGVLAWRRRNRIRRIDSQEGGRTSVFGVRETGEGRARKPFLLLGRYLEHCEAMGFPKRPSQTLAEHLAWMKQEEACGTEFDGLNRYLYGRLYGQERGSGEETEREDEFRRKFRW